MAIEVTTYGVADDERFIFTNFLAGMTSTAKTDGSKPANDITDVPLMTHWRGPATQGQILHITFPTPVMAKYVLLQGRNLNHPWNIAELKVIEGKQVALTPRLMCHYSSFPSATFDECPKRDKVVVTSNQVQHTDYSGQNWEDCAVRCEATPGCDCWNWNPAYMICRSDTGCYVRMHRYAGCYNYSTGECQAPSPLTGLIGGTRGCTAHSSVAGWVTCTDTPPYDSLANYEKEEVPCSTAVAAI